MHENENNNFNSNNNLSSNNGIYNQQNNQFVNNNNLYSQQFNSVNNSNSDNNILESSENYYNQQNVNDVNNQDYNIVNKNFENQNIKNVGTRMFWHINTKFIVPGVFGFGLLFMVFAIGIPGNLYKLILTLCFGYSILMTILYVIYWIRNVRNDVQQNGFSILGKTTKDKIKSIAIICIVIFYLIMYLFGKFK